MSKILMIAVCCLLLFPMIPDARGDDEVVSAEELVKRLILPDSGVSESKDLVVEGNVAPEVRTRSMALPSSSRGIKIVGTTNLNTIQFEYNSDRLLPQAKRQLDELAKALRSDQLKNNVFKLVGHTDAYGSDAYNLNLSIRRAESAARYLVHSCGIPAVRIVPTGVGEQEPVDSTDPYNAINRMVEVSNSGAYR